MHSRINRCSYSKEYIYTTMCLASERGTYTSYIRGSRCRKESDFFREISASLQFPFYFGENWAALDECLCDLEWLHFQKMLVIIDDYSLLFCAQPNLKTMLQERVADYFRVMAEYWEMQDKIVEIWLNC